VIKKAPKKAKSDNSLMADEWGLLISSGFYHEHLGNYWATTGQLLATLDLF